MTMLARLREWAYGKKLLRTVELPAFTVSIGNISLGGTGKSAFVMWLSVSRPIVPTCSYE